MGKLHFRSTVEISTEDDDLIRFINWMQSKPDCVQFK